MKSNYYEPLILTKYREKRLRKISMITREVFFTFLLLVYLDFVLNEFYAHVCVLGFVGLLVTPFILMLSPSRGMEVLGRT